MTTAIAHLFLSLCIATIFFQIALIVGAPLGEYTQGGRVRGKLDTRGRAMALASIPVLAFQAVAVLSAAGFPGIGWPAWTGWAALALACVTAVLNQITPSDREKAVWGPVTLVMAALAGYVVIVGP